MLCTHHMLCEMVSFTKILLTHSIFNRSSFIPSSKFCVCLCWSGFFSALLALPLKKSIKNAKVTGCPLIHLSALKVLPQATQSHQPALRGVNSHFPQLSQMCDEGKRIPKSTGATTLQISRPFEILNCVIKEDENPNSPNQTQHLVYF